jgi:hypothetical protein
MIFVLFAKALGAYSQSLPEAAQKVKPVANWKKLNAYQFSQNGSVLHFIEIGEENRVELTLKDQTIRIRFPPFKKYLIRVENHPCFIIVHHWGRGVSFRINEAEPEWEILQIGFEEGWGIFSQEPCIAVTSGGTDPIAEVLECFFEQHHRRADELSRIETEIRKYCRKAVQ